MEQAEFGVLDNGVAGDFDVFHCKLAVVYGDAVHPVAVGDIVADDDVGAVVDVQAFAVVVVGAVVAEGNAEIVAARHGGDAVTGAAVSGMAVVGESVVVGDEFFLIGNQGAGDAVVVQVAVFDTVVFAGRQIVVGFVEFAVLYPGFESHAFFGGVFLQGGG